MFNHFSAGDFFFWLSVIAFALCISSLFNGFVIPKILQISFQKHLFDELDERKIHHDLVPRLGGFAFAPCIMFTVSLSVGLLLLINQDEIFTYLVAESCSIAFGLCALTLIFLIGTMDDLVGVRYCNKFIVQVFCAVLLILGGIWLDDLHGLFGIYELPKWAGYPLTILVVVFITNAINLMDGIDGLASGLSAIALIYYGIVFFAEEKYMFSLISFTALGTIIPFYYYNVFGNARKGKKIFMGDTGSLTLGLILSFLSIELGSYTPDENLSSYNYFALAFSPLIIPCFDVVRVFFHRIRRGHSPFLPDKNHLHHKMLAMGMEQHPVMITILSMAAALIVVNLILSAFIEITILLVLNMIFWLFFIFYLNYRIHQYNLKKNIPDSKD